MNEGISKSADLQRIEHQTNIRVNVICRNETFIISGLEKAVEINRSRDKGYASRVKRSRTRLHGIIHKNGAKRRGKFSFMCTALGIRKSLRITLNM